MLSLHVGALVAISVYGCVVIIGVIVGTVSIVLSWRGGCESQLNRILNFFLLDG